MNTRWSVAIVALAIGPTGFAQNPGPERLNSVEIRSEKVDDGLYVLFGFGGAMTVSIGAQGVLAVDTQFPELVPKINAEIKKLGGAAVDFAINTHWHYDHADGNMGFLAAKPTAPWDESYGQPNNFIDRVYTSLIR